MKKQLTIDEVKQIELEILLAFHKFCNENSLQYSLCGGTLLGAIRHKGFIPWDDDIDVFMPRPDYDKLRELCANKIISKNYILYDWHYPVKEIKERKPMYYPFIKMVDTRTDVKAKDFNYKKYFSGIWIDIFPVDGLPTSDKETQILFKQSWFWRQMFSLHYCDKINAKGTFQKIVKIPFLPFAKLMNGTKICKKLENISLTYDYNSANYVGGIINGYGPQEKISKEDMKPIEVEFEGYKVLGIKGYDKYLTNLYHDYMVLPPENKRICHGFDAWIFV